MALSVSVALCTFNGERFIEQQLRSILDQTEPPKELVISDDASSDRTMAVVESTITQWRRQNSGSRLDVVRFKNSAALGVARNFEQAVLAATGDLIALSDQDDVWLPDRLERMVSIFEARPQLLLLHTDAFLIDAAGTRESASLFEALEISARTRDAIHAGEAFNELVKRNIVTGATTVFRRTLASLAAPFPPGWLHDEWLAIAAASTGTLDLLEEKLLEYRQHGANEVGAQKLSLSTKAGRVLEGGDERNRRLLTRAESLVERFDVLDVSPPYRGVVADKLAHERLRSSLGPHRLSRVRPVLAELRTGRYRWFGRGTVDALRDLLQPLRGTG